MSVSTREKADMGIVDQVTSGIAVRAAEKSGPFAIGGRVVFTITHPDLGADIAEGTVRKITESGRSVFLLIETGHGITFTRHACDVQPASDWRERVDRAVAEAVGEGDGPVPILLHPDSPPGPAVSVYWMHGSVLVLGIYTSATTGIVYRWQDGPEQAPAVIHWDLSGPECQ